MSTRKDLPGLPNRWAILGAAVAATVVVIALLSFALEGSELGVILLDRQGPTYPLTIQTVMLLLFGVGLGEIFLRWRVAEWENRFLDEKLLPEDDETVLQRHDLAPIRRRVVGHFDGDNGFLPSLIDLCILQFQASRSVDQTVSVLNSSLELIAHRVEMRYSMIRYVVWAIPTFGFIGTVLGISSGLSAIDTESGELGPVLGHLGLAFNTTLVALALSAVLVFLLHVVERREEQSVNLAGGYCLRNLINRLYTGGP
jgi:biopolymer transport protein ExbB/TolQ